MTSVEPASAPADGSLRILRAAVFALCAVWLSSTAHVLGGGAAPSVVVTGLLMLFVATPAALLAGRRRGPTTITVGLLTLQAGLHLALAATTRAQSCTVIPAMPAGHHPGMTHPMPAHAFECGGVSATAPVMSGMTASMLITHSVAAVVLALLLSLGERVLWQVVTWFVPRLTTTVPRMVMATEAIARVVASRASRRLVIRLLVGGLGRRGPPRVSGAPA